MNIRNILVASAFALATPAVAFAADGTQTLTVSQASTAAINALSSADRTQVQNILSLLQNGQLNNASAASQIDAVLSDDEVKAVLAQAAKVQGSDATDAGQFLADAAKPPSKS